MKTDLIKKQILIKFGTYAECAKALGIAPSTLTHLLKNPSYKFLKRLQEHGIDIQIDEPKIKFYIDKFDNINLVNDNAVEYKDITALKLAYKICLEENKILKAEIYDLKKKMEMLDGKNN